MNFNSVIKDCVKNMEFEAKNQGRYFYSSNDHYNSTLVEQVGSYSIPIAERKKIDAIFINKSNADGHIAGAIVYHYVKSKNKNAEIDLLRVGAGANRLLKILNRVKGKNIIFLDLAIDGYVYQKFAKECKKVYSIDDHAPPKEKLPDNVHLVTSDSGHGASGMTWKIFYPKKKIPKPVRIIDTQDSSKFMKGLPYGNWFVSSLTFKFFQNPKISQSAWASGKPLEEIWNIIEGDESNFYIVLGKYMADVQESIKEQVSQHAVIRDYQGFKVGCINWLDPVLTKRLSRQINTMYEGQIDFAVVFGYEMRNSRWRVFMGDNHRDDRINLGKLASILGKKCGDADKGSGHTRIGSFYVKGKNNVWNLFEKNLLTDSERKSIMLK